MHPVPSMPATIARIQLFSDAQIFPVAIQNAARPAEGADAMPSALLKFEKIGYLPKNLGELVVREDRAVRAEERAALLVQGMSAAAMSSRKGTVRTPHPTRWGPPRPQTKVAKPARLAPCS